MTALICDLFITCTLEQSPTLDIPTAMTIMLFKFGAVLAIMTGTTLAVVCPGSSSREEGDPFSVYPASGAGLASCSEPERTLTSCSFFFG
jgi:hypothetical protein